MPTTRRVLPKEREIQETENRLIRQKQNTTLWNSEPREWLGLTS